jgi:hypothetical protein
MAKYLVLSVKSYDFENDKKERVVGAKISYLNRKPSKKENECGYPPLIVSINDKEVLSQLQQAPAIYELEFEQTTGKNNKPEILLTEVEYISPVDLSILFS